MGMDLESIPKQETNAPKNELSKTMNGAMSAEDIEHQLRSQQLPSNNNNGDEQQQQIDDEDIDQYEVMHHTPELKPDPRELVEEDANIPPEWAADGTEDETQAILDTDFQFGVIDKDRDRAHFKETGQLPSDVVTIPHQEYERRKELEIQQNAATNVGPSKPPIHHTNEHNDFVQNGPPKDTVYGHPQPPQHPHQQQIPPRHQQLPHNQQQQHASVPYPYPQDPYM